MRGNAGRVKPRRGQVIVWPGGGWRQPGGPQRRRRPRRSRRIGRGV